MKKEPTCKISRTSQTEELLRLLDWSLLAGNCSVLPGCDVCTKQAGVLPINARLPLFTETVIMVHRLTFNSRVRQESESIRDFLSSVRK